MKPMAEDVNDNETSGVKGVFWVERCKHNQKPTSRHSEHIYHNSVLNNSPICDHIENSSKLRTCREILLSTTFYIAHIDWSVEQHIHPPRLQRMQSHSRKKKLSKMISQNKRRASWIISVNSLLSDKIIDCI